MLLVRQALRLGDLFLTLFQNALRNPNSNLYKRLSPLVRSVAIGSIPKNINPGRSLRDLKNRPEKPRNLSIREGQVDIDDCGEEVIYSISEDKEPVEAEYVIQLHDAERAGLHWDFQINKDGHGHRWVIPKMKMPELPGRPQLAIQQPTHTESYVNFKGKILEGYGKGTVKHASRGKLDVFHSSDDQVDFVIYDRPYDGHYKMMRIYIQKNGSRKVFGSGESPSGTPSVQWMLLQKRDGKYSPTYLDRSNSYSDVKEEFDPTTHIISLKEDGANAKLHTNRSKYGRVVLASRRPPKDTNKSYRSRGGILHMEDNLPWIRDLKLKMEVNFIYRDISLLLRTANISDQMIRDYIPLVKDNVVVGSVFTFEDYEGGVYEVEVFHSLGSSYTAGLLNSHPMRARELQQETGKARVILFDAIEHEGKDVSKLPYQERLRKCKIFAAKHPEVEVARQIPKGKSHKEWHREIIRQKHEGTVATSKDQLQGEKMYKIKGPMGSNYRRSYFIVGFQEEFDKNGVGKGRAGAILYSDSPKGKPIGPASGKISHLEKQHIWDNQKKYLGKEIVIESRHPIPKDNSPVRAPIVHEIKLGVEPGIEG